MISPRTREGSLAAEQYVIVGPGFRGRLPRHFDDDHIIQSLSRFTWLIGRTRVFNPDDLPDAVLVQSGYTLSSLDNKPPKAHNIPLFPFVKSEDISTPIPEPQVFFSYANFIVNNYLEIEDSESDIFKRFAKIEVGPSKEFIGQNMSQQMYQDIQQGIADGSKKVSDALSYSDITVRGWTVFNEPAAVHGDYLARAAYTRFTVFPSVPQEETRHIIAFQDVDGDLLNSTKHNYTLTISPGEFPNVVEAYGGFWSITVYTRSDSRLGDLVHNPIDRYAIASDTPGVVYDADGTLTLYFQNKRPDTDEKVANWLPTPDLDFGGYKTGDFHVRMRVYQSQDLSVFYYPPGIMKLKQHFEHNVL